jgi:DNA-binding transcriptional ArsR family regulator
MVGSLDSTLMALADPTRRAILNRIAQGEVRVTEVAKPFSVSLNAISKHIQVLERAGLVRRRREGREHLLSLDSRPIDEAAGWIEAHRVMWAKRLDILDELLKAQDRAQPSLSLTPFDEM